MWCTVHSLFCAFVRTMTLAYFGYLGDGEHHGLWEIPETCEMWICSFFLKLVLILTTVSENMGFTDGPHHTTPTPRLSLWWQSQAKVKMTGRIDLRNPFINWGWYQSDIIKYILSQVNFLHTQGQMVWLLTPYRDLIVSASTTVAELNICRHDGFEATWIKHSATLISIHATLLVQICVPGIQMVTLAVAVLSWRRT